jgi:hypothetical protein
MWLQAIVTPTDLERMLGEITPVQIALDREDPGRYLWLDRPSHVETTDGEGIRIVTSARLQWDVIGIKVPVMLRAVTVLVIPSVTRRDGHDVLAFSARIEQADLSSVPELIEMPLIARINEALAGEQAQLAWHFTETLDFHFHLPDAMDPPRGLRLFARWGAVRTSHEGMALAASFSLDAEPPEVASDHLAAGAAERAPSAATGRSDTIH